MMTKPITVQLVEDEPLWQLGIAQLLSTDPQLILMHTSSAVSSALAAFNTQPAQVLLCDWQLPNDESGLDVAFSLIEQGQLQASQVIVISGSDPSILPTHPFGFVPKSQIASQLVAAIHQAALTVMVSAG